MKLTYAERKLINLENSYRVERTTFTLLSVLSALPLLEGIGATILGLFRFRNDLGILRDLMLEADWNSLFPALCILLLFCFLAYRAQSKLTLINYLKRHLETQGCEPIAVPSGDPATRSVHSGTAAGPSSVS